MRRPSPIDCKKSIQSCGVWRDLAAALRVAFTEFDAAAVAIVDARGGRFTRISAIERHD
jgi:hypothetical protein